MPTCPGHVDFVPGHVKLCGNVPKWASDIKGKTHAYFPSSTHQLYKAWTVLQLSGRQMRPMKRSGNTDITKYWSDWQPKKFFLQNSMSDRPRQCSHVHVSWTCGYQNMHIFFHIHMSDHPKCVWTTQRTHWVVRWVTQPFSLAAALQC